MQKLHLVGFTTDQQGLILSARRGARSGSFHLPLDGAVADAVDELRARQAEELAEAGEDDAPPVREPRVESALPVREIQARLRQGRSVAEVAKAAGVEPTWVERFAAPVFAERAQVVAKVQGMTLGRPRLGPSSQTIGEAVRRNLADRGVTHSPEEFADAWTARQLADGRWVVALAFRHRRKDQTLRFDLDEATGLVTAADRLSSQLAYVAPPASPTVDVAPRRRSTGPGRDDQPTAKRATVTTGFRPEADAVKAVSRPAKERERASQAMRTAAARGAAEAERAAARKVQEKQDAARRAEREAKVEEARRRREHKAAEQAKATAARAKAAAAKKAAAERDRRKAERQKAAQAKRAEAALRAVERARATAKAAAAEEAADRRAAAQKAAADARRRAESERAAARKRAAADKAARTSAAKRAAAKASAKTATAKRASAKKATAKKAVARVPVPATKAPAKLPAKKVSVRQVAVQEAGVRAAATPAPAHLFSQRPAASAPVQRTPTRLPVRLRDDLLAARPPAPPPSPRGASVRAEPVQSPRQEARGPDSNGRAASPPLDRPRRTRPLRAT